MVHKYPHLLCNNYTTSFTDNPVFDIWLYIVFSKFTAKEKNTNFFPVPSKNTAHIFFGNPGAQLFRP